MKKLNINKITLAIGLVLTITSAQAQWATYDITRAIYDYYDSMRDYVQNSNLQVIQNGQQLQMAQAAQNVENADYRNRLSKVYDNILKDDESSRPTYQTCIELSKVAVGSSSLAASMSSGGRGGGGGGGGRKRGAPPEDKHYDPEKPTDVQENIRSKENAQANVLKNIQNTQTCHPRYGEPLCPKEAGEYALADVSSFGLLSNSAKSEKINKNLDFANYSMNKAGHKAGSQYISVATMAVGPKFPDPEDIKKNPAYIAMYNAMIIKLNASGEALKSILDLRIAPEKINAEVKKIWDTSDNINDWDTVFPMMKRPTVPSYYEFLNSRITFDVFGPKALSTMSSGNLEDTTKGIQNKMALNNLISWNQYIQQEKTNILLSHILVQLTTPISKEEVDKEYAKFEVK